VPRFKLMGYLVEGQDENTRPLSQQEQRVPRDNTVVYETDDQAEATAILRAGGFFKDRDRFYYVGNVVDGAEPAVEPFPQRGA
jgi:hypothetical protein